MELGKNIDNYAVRSVECSVKIDTVVNEADGIIDGGLLKIADYAKTVIDAYNVSYYWYKNVS
jgi:hypothetical protein